MNDTTVKIKEIFTSIQGEGPYIGYKQLFIRFCGCNLKCDYCDTDFEQDKYFDEFTALELSDFVDKYTNFHSISLTGGEPLLSTTFLKEFLPLVSDKQIYLETNATLAEKLSEVIDLVDIIAADIKLESATGIKNTYKLHDKFFELAKQKECFAKVVFDEKITDEEIKLCVELCEKHAIDLVLQPMMSGSCMLVSGDFGASILNKFLKRYSRVRLIPQMHKFLGVE